MLKDNCIQFLSMQHIIRYLCANISPSCNILADLKTGQVGSVLGGELTSTVSSVAVYPS